MAETLGSDLAAAPTSWSEDDSRLYRSLARVAVPRREAMLAALLAQIPYPEGEAFRLVELGSGEGLLARAALELFPGVEVRALDGSAAMRHATEATCEAHRSRLTVAPFDLLDLEARDPAAAAEPAWLEHLEGADAVVSSLCVHHLSSPGKRALFAAAAERLAPGGALMIFDLVEPAGDVVRALWAAQWDVAASARAAQVEGGARALEAFHREGWNLYRHPDPVDKPSPLVDQLRWLREAGFEEAECTALVAGHALYGGRKPGSAASRNAPSSVSLSAARAAVERAFGEP